MDALQIALVTLVSVWTLVSAVLGVLVVLLLRRIDAALVRLNALLDSTQHVADDVRVPVQALADSVREVFGTRHPPLPAP